MGGVVGPVLAGSIFDITASYQLAFLGCIAIVVAGLVSTLALRPISREKGESGEILVDDSRK